MLQPKLSIDLEMKMVHANLDLVQGLKVFEPFGEKNNRPIFLSPGVRVLDKRLVEKDGRRHLKLLVGDESTSWMPAIGWDMGELIDRLKDQRHIDLVYMPEENFYDTNNPVQLSIVDFRIA
jgi:single-stranded-DNA-specific exonuclease